MNQLLFEQGPQGAAAALLKDNHLVEYLPLGSEEGIPTESVYLGQVGRVMKPLGACFVALPGRQEGFLPCKQTKLQPGDRVLVQVKRPGVGSKTPHMTRDIALSGRTLVYLPLGQGDKVSARVEEKNDRQRLKTFAAAIPRQEGGFIMRHMSLHAEEPAILQEAQSLVAQWETLKEKAARLSPPVLLREAPHPLYRLLRDLQEQVDEVVTNDMDSLAFLGLPLRYAASPMALYNVQEKLRKALRRKVFLPSGASLMIDPCEAMTVIDVNSEKCTIGSHCGKTQVNLEAAEGIARLLRLRGVGGIVLIDFIDMDTKEEREQVLAALSAHLKWDRVKTTVQGFTALGFVEMTRKRAEETLPAQKGICPYCQGSGIKPLKEEDMHA